MPRWEGDFSAANVWGRRTTSSHYDRLSRLTRRARRMNCCAQTAMEDCIAAIVNAMEDCNDRNRCAEADCTVLSHSVAAVSNGRNRCAVAESNGRSVCPDVNPAVA